MSECDRKTIADRQSRTMSAVEGATNVVVGFALATQFTVFPMLGLAVSVTNNLILGCTFAVVSMLRSFTLRRLFEALRVRSLSAEGGGG